jgi:hypothetical protein
MIKKWQIFLLIAAVVLAGHFIAYNICNIPTQLELTAIVAAALIYPVVRYPVAGIYALFIISPFIPFVRRLYYLAYGRPGIDPIIIIGDIIVVMVFAGFFWELRSDNLPRRYMNVVAVYIAYLVFRTFVFTALPVSEGIWKMKYYVPSVLLFFTGIICAKNIENLKRLWLLTIVIGIASCLYGIKQLYVGYSDAERLWFSSIHFTTLFIKGIARPFSFFQAPAVFADYLLMSILGTLMYISWSRFRGKTLLLLLIPMFFYGILITSVRSNWIGTIAVFILWFLVFEIKNSHYRTAAIVVSIILLPCIQIAGDLIKSHGIDDIDDIIGDKAGKQEYINIMVTSRAKAIVNPFEEHSMMSRIALWKYMILLSSDPQMALLGRGLGTLNADSLYITYLSEFGYPGLIFISGIFVAFIFSGIRRMHSLSDPDAAILAKGIVCMNISLALMNFTGTHIHSFPGDVYFWFWNGVLMNISVVDKKHGEAMTI